MGNTCYNYYVIRKREYFMKYPNDPNDLDWGSMSKAEFKAAELHYELRDEEESKYETYEVCWGGSLLYLCGSGLLIF